MPKSPLKLIMRIKLDEKSSKILFWAYQVHKTLLIYCFPNFKYLNFLLPWGDMMEAMIGNLRFLGVT